MPITARLDKKEGCRISTKREGVGKGKTRFGKMKKSFIYLQKKAQARKENPLMEVAL